MKRLSAFLVVIFLFSVSYAQEINGSTADSSFVSDSDSLEIVSADSVNTDIDSIDFSSQKFIENFSQLPAQQYYKQDWNEEHVRLKAVPIPFVNDSLRLILNKDNFIFPVKNGKVISEYGVRHGRMHTGTDIKQRLNDTVVACFDGVVRLARQYGGYGKVVVVRHPNGLESVYSHLNRIKVKPKQLVKAGQMVGLAGRTGRATTEHLHFELRFLYEHFNTRKAIDYTTESLFSDTLVLTAKDLHRQATAAKPQESASESQENQTAGTAQSSERPSVHIVRKGDTLYKISRTYGVPVKTLLKLNKISEDSILSIGQKIKLK